MELDYVKPEISDYGNLKELTEGCAGASGDFPGYGVNTSKEFTTPSGHHCVTT